MKPPLPSASAFWLDLTIILLLCVAKLYLVAPALGPASLYRDDAWQSLAVRVTTPRDVMKAGVTAPGFASGLRLIQGPNQVSETTLQLPALLAGLLGPALLYGIARWWGLSRATALVAAVLLAVAPTHTDYSTRVKPYTWDVIGTLVSLALARRACDRPTEWLPWAMLLGVSATAFAISATAGFAGFALALATVVVRWFDTRRVQWSDLGLLGIYCGLLGIWYLFILDAKSNEALYAYWHNRFIVWEDGPVAVLKAIVSNGARLFVNLLPDNTDPSQVTSALRYMLPLALLYGLAALAGLVVLWKTNWRYGLLLAAPLVFAVALFVVGKFPLGGGRTDLYLAPLQALLAASLLEWRRLQSAANWIAAVACCGLLLAAGIGARASYPREDLRSLTAEVERQAGPSDRILVFPETTYMYALYSRAKVSVATDPLSMTGFTPVLSDARVSMMPGMQFSTSIFPRGEAVCVAQLEQAMLARPAKIWLVASIYYPQDTLPILDERLKAGGWREQTGLQYENVVARIWTLEASASRP